MCFFLLSCVFPFMLKCQQGFLAGCLPVWVRMKWLNTQVGMVFLLQGGAVQGRNETQESPEGKYTDKAEGKPLQNLQQGFPCSSGVGNRGLGVLWGRWRGFSEPSPCLQSCPAQPSQPGQGLGGIQEGITISWSSPCAP